MADRGWCPDITSNPESRVRLGRPVNGLEGAEAAGLNRLLNVGISKHDQGGIPTQFKMYAPFGGVGLSGNGYRIGGQQANLEAFTEMQWITVNQETSSSPLLVGIRCVAYE